MTPRGKKLSALVIAGCTVFAISGASTAVAAVPKAKAKVSLETRNFVLPPGNVNGGVGTATAPCPGNRTMTGGGSTFGAGLPLATNIELVTSGPTGNAWETTYDNNPDVAQSVFTYALCLKNKLKVKGGEGGNVRPKVRQVTTPFVLPPDGTNFGIASVDVACPGGYTVVSGGVRFLGGTAGTTGPNEVTVFESGPEGNGWHVQYDNDSDQDGANAEASALCLKNKSKVKKGEDGKARAKVTEVTETLTLPPDATNVGVAEFDVPCPGGTKLVGGGARFAPGTTFVETDEDANGIELFESGPNGNSWHVRYNNNEAGAQTVLVTANCLRKNLKVK